MHSKSLPRGGESLLAEVSYGVRLGYVLGQSPSIAQQQ